MHMLSDITTYVRRIIKAPSNSVISDNLIIDFINRFYLNDVDARIQLFDLKTTYRFQTVPGVDQYNMPLYNVQIQPGNQNIGMYPVYQGFLDPVYINGVQVSFQTQKSLFNQNWPNFVQNMGVVAVGNNTTGPYTCDLPILGVNSVPPNPPFNGILRGHIDMSGIIATGNNVDPPVVTPGVAATLIPQVPVTSVDSKVFFTTQDSNGASVVVQDSGQFFEGNVNLGYLMYPGKAPNGNLAMGASYSATSNVINYFTGECSITFNSVVPTGVNINAQALFYTSGLPRTVLFYNNVLTLRSPPSQQWLVELTGYLTPAAFLNTANGIPFGYMAEYIARGAARKILSDTGDTEQFMFYEPLFKEQEMLVWKRSQRQTTATRSQTIFSQGQVGSNSGNNGGNLYGGY